jgi:hypothetical protein
MMDGLGDLLLLASLRGDGGVCVDRHRRCSVEMVSSREALDEDMVEMRAALPLYT